MSDNDPAKTAVFISYAREDLKHAERLYNELKKAEFKPWLDKHNLVAGQDWKEEIMDAIENSRFFIPLFSSNSVQKIKGILNVFGAYDHTNVKMHVHCYRNKTGKQFVDFLNRVDRQYDKNIQMLCCT